MLAGPASSMASNGGFPATNSTDIAESFRWRNDKASEREKKREIPIARHLNVEKCKTGNPRFRYRSNYKVFVVSAVHSNQLRLLLVVSHRLDLLDLSTLSTLSTLPAPYICLLTLLKKTKKKKKLWSIWNRCVNAVFGWF